MPAELYPRHTPSQSIGSNRLRARGAEARWLARLVTRQMLGQMPLDPADDLRQSPTTTPAPGRQSR